MRKWLWAVITVVAWLGLGSCTPLEPLNKAKPLEKQKPYIKGKVEDVLRWKWADALTIELSQQDECKNWAKIVWYDDNWQPIIDITRECVK